MKAEGGGRKTEMGEEENVQRSTSNVQRPTKRFVCQYYHDGAWWGGTDIWAYDAEDAEARVRKLGNLQLLGEHVATIPAIAGAGWLVRALCAARNFFFPTGRLT